MLIAYKFGYDDAQLDIVRNKDEILSLSLSYRDYLRGCIVTGKQIGRAHV